MDDRTEWEFFDEPSVAASAAAPPLPAPAVVETPPQPAVAAVEEPAIEAGASESAPVAGDDAEGGQNGGEPAASGVSVAAWPPAKTELCGDPEAFFRLLYKPGDVFEVRSLHCPTFPGANKKRTASGYFDHPEKAAKCARYLDVKRKPAGIYCTLNPVLPDLLGRSSNKITDDANSTTTDAQIVRRRWFVLDIDCIRPAGMSATDSETKAAVALAKKIREELAVCDWPDPVSGMSGNGAYLLYLIDLPNDDQATDLIKRVLHGLAKRFDNEAAKIDRSTFNASRIIKVFGTTARKGDNFLGTDSILARPHRVAKFRPPSGKLRPVPVAFLKAVAAKPEEMRPQAHATNGHAAHLANGGSRGRGKSSAIDRCRAYLVKMPDAVQGQHGSDQTFSAACTAFRFGLSDVEAATVLADYNAAKCTPPWSEAELAHKLAGAKAEVMAAGDFGSMLNRSSGPALRAPSTPLVSSSQLNWSEGDEDDIENEDASDSLDFDTSEGRTDTANARRFVAMHGNDVRWCDPWRKWLVWDGRRWAIDAQRRVEALAKQVADQIWRDLAAALQTMEKDTSNEIIRFARTTSNARGIADMLTLVKSEPGIAILPTSLDAHPWLFNCLNTTVDLKTGRGIPHSRQHYITKLCPHEYQPQSEPELTVWKTTLERIFGGNVELLGFFRRLCGSAMVGEVIEQLLPILWGKGSNGKSLVMETLLEAMGGDYADKGASDLLLASQGDRHPTEKADLFGKRLVVCAETEEGRRLAESMVKELTGGDTVKGRRMKEDFWSFRPSHSLFLVTNHKPIIRGTDHGIWRRLPLIPFTQQFWDGSKGESGPAEYEADPRLKEKLRPEMPGILHWLVEACLEWQREGLRQPAEVAAATADYRGTMDTLAEFLADCCTLQEGCTTKAADVLRRYAEWCKERNDKPVSSRRFGEYLAERGITKRRSGGVWYSGLLVRESF